MTSNNAKMASNNAICDANNTKAQTQQKIAAERNSDHLLKEEAFYVVTQTTYTCGMLADGALGVYRTYSDVALFENEAKATKQVSEAIAAMFAAYGVKNWKSRVVKSKDEIHPDSFGYVFTENENAAFYNMWDTRGKYPCDFIDFRIEKRTFYCSRANAATNEKIKTSFDVDCFFKEEKLANEMAERKNTLEELKKLFRKQ